MISSGGGVGKMNYEYGRCRTMAGEIADIVKLTPAIFEAFCQTPRSDFAPSSISAFSLDAHPIAGDQWISSPLTVAKMTSFLEAEGCDNVLEIGCGSGYQAAILSHLAHRVFTVERISELASSAKERLRRLGFNNINVRHDDGSVGWPSFAPFDRIIFSCAASFIPERIFSQLKDGGILVAPIGVETQTITKFIKNGNEITKIALDECKFVPLKSGRG